MRTLICLLCLVTFSAFSQNILLKKNGDQIPFKRFKFEAGSLLLRTADRDELSVSPEQVVGYYDEDQQVVLYKVPLLDIPQPFVIFGALKKEDPYEFFERVLDGDIRIYKKESVNQPGPMVNGMATSSGSTDYLYAERGGQYKLVYVGGIFQNREDEKQALLTFIEDDDDLVAKVKAQDFTYNRKNVIKVILDYNLKHLDRSLYKPSMPTKSVGFYTQMRKKIKESMVIKVNDSIEYRFGPKFPVQIPLPIGIPSKVCVTSLAGNGCMIFTAVPFAMYFQIENNVLKEDLEFKREGLQQFKNHMMYVMKNN